MLHMFLQVRFCTLVKRINETKRKQLNEEGDFQGKWKQTVTQTLQMGITCLTSSNQRLRECVRQLYCNTLNDFISGLSSPNYS